MASGSVAEIKSRLAVADVVGETVALRKAGTTMKGLCPFHGEKTPSFVVTPARETWKCFGCGKGGDIFTFVMERDALTFGEALTLLAAKAGIVIDDRSRAEDARKARLREVLEGAVGFYHAILTGHELGRPALAYLRSRGFTDATIEAQRIGWAPDSWDACSKALAAKRGATAAELEAVGLTTDRGGVRGAYDRFRARVIFPIRDANGKVTATKILTGEAFAKVRGEFAVANEASAQATLKAQARPDDLSGGQQQRVAIARALVTEPSILMGDEPTGNLDSKTSREVIELFRQLNEERGITVILVTHDLNVAKNARRILVLRDGSIVADTTKFEEAFNFLHSTGSIHPEDQSPQE